MDDTNRQTQKHRPRKKRRIIMILFILLLLPALTVYFAPPAILSSDFFRDKIVGKINEEPDITCSIGDISFGWFKGFSCENVEIKNNDNSYKMQHASIKIRLKPLMSGRVIINNAVLDQPDATVYIKDITSAGDTETINQTLPKKSSVGPAPESSKENLIIEHIDFKIANGRVNLILVSDNTEQSVIFDNINSELEVNSDEIIFGTKMSVKEDRHVSRITATGKLSGFHIQDFDISSLNGRITGNTDDLFLKSLHPLIAMTQNDIKPEGILNAQSEFIINNGKAENIKISAGLKDFKNTGPKGSYKLEENVDISADITNKDNLEISDLTIKSSFMNLTCSGDSQTVNYDMTGDFEKSTAFIRQFIDLDKYDFYGTMKSKGTLNLGKDKYVGSGRIELSRFKFDYKNKPSPADDFVINHTITYDKTSNLVSFESIKVISDPATVQLSGSGISPNKLFTRPFELAANGNIDMNRMNKYIVLFRDEPLDKITDSVKLNINSKYNPSGTGEKFEPKNLIASASVDFEKAEYKGLSLGKTEIYTNLENGILNILPFDSETNRGKLHFSGNIDFNKDPHLLTIPELVTLTNIEINDTVAKEFLSRINIIFDEAADVSGRATLNCSSLSIPLGKNYEDMIYVDCTLTVDPLNMSYGGLLGEIVKHSGSRVNQQQMALLESRYILKNGYVTYENTQLNIGDNPFNFTGKVPLDEDKPMELTVISPWQSSGRTASIEDITEDRIPVTITGTRKNPELNIEKTIEDIGRKLIEKQLEKLFK